MAIKRDAADKWFSDCIRFRAGYACECCGKSYGGPHMGLHCAHIFGRRNASTRWCTDNAVSLCFACHHRFGEHPIEFTEWVTARYGEGMIQILTEKKRAVFKTTAAIRKEIAAHYREQFGLMESDLAHTLISYQ